MSENEPRGIYDLFNEAQSGTLPADFDQWDRSSPGGWSVAHQAAYFCRLPADFDQWGLVAREGWSVAHEAARRGHLPADFDQWDLTDESGRSVAHVAEINGHPRPDPVRRGRLYHMELTG